MKVKSPTNFHEDNILKEGCQWIYWSAILNDSIFGTGKSYYPQVLLEERKYIVKEKQMSSDDVEIFFDEKNSD